MSRITSYICGCVKNCEPHLNGVFHNINLITKMLDDYRIIIAYDESSDNTLQELHVLRKTFPEGKMTIIMGDSNLSYIRTQNIANARNRILNSIREDKENMFEYFIMMDMDEVCSGKMNKKLLRRFLKSGNDLPWDALTFNRSVYYDVWALSIKPYTFSCWHYANHKQIYTNMVHYVNKQLADVAIHDSRNALLPCISAFNGFGLYRTAKFICSKYEWNVHATLAIYPKSEIDIMSRQVLSQPIARHDDCEHRYFHIRASQLNGARICISPNCLFS
tara:strand:+ start:1050 stop:1877 length:828 start_codon:yes stop_codon:yes gene_type:complete